MRTTVWSPSAATTEADQLPEASAVTVWETPSTATSTEELAWVEPVRVGLAVEYHHSVDCWPVTSRAPMLVSWKPAAETPLTVRVRNTRKTMMDLDRKFIPYSVSIKPRRVQVEGNDKLDLHVINLL